MHNGDLKLAFLGRVQQSIGCWQPTLEQKFRVALGNVQAKPLIVRDFVNTIIERARTQSALSSPPRSSRFKHLLFELERRTVWLPALAFVYLRFWLPELVMKWSEPPPVILVSFLGWKKADFEKNQTRIDQWTVHELAHGIWRRLAPENERRDGNWRLWNEGFAHYVADVHFRAQYPSNAVIENWSGVRSRAKERITHALQAHGPGILREIPSRWQELDQQFNRDAPSTNRSNQ